MIARALMKDSSLLILDEATSALDAESESVVMKIVNGRSVLIIAHKLSLVENVADYIYVLDQGNIVEAGTHAELMAIKNGRYRKLREIN
jgi:ABC-type multidrug transport system fused ATPase/permease subunit